MSLPFLQPKRMGAMLIAKYKAPEGGEPSLEPDHVEGEPHPGVLAAAEALISAVHSKDAEAAAQALEDAYEVLCNTGES